MKFISNVHLSYVMDKVGLRNNLKCTQIEFYEYGTTAWLLWKDRAHADYLASKKLDLEYRKLLIQKAPNVAEAHLNS